jgi:hypothetical protein
MRPVAMMFSCILGLGETLCDPPCPNRQRLSTEVLTRILQSFEDLSVHRFHDPFLCVAAFYIVVESRSGIDLKDAIGLCWLRDVGAYNIDAA